MALLKKLQNAANDFRPKPTASRAVRFIMPAYGHPLAFRVAIIFLLSMIATLLALNLWQMHAQKTAIAPMQAKPVTEVPTAKIIVKLERDDKPQKLAEKLPLPVSKPKPESDTINDIVLPAQPSEGILLPANDVGDKDVAPVPISDPTIAVVAQKISGLPALRKVDAQENKSPIHFHSEVALTEDQLLMDAHNLLKVGDNQAALERFDAVLKRDKTSRPAMEGKMFVLQRMGQGEQAVAIGRQLLKLDPDNAAAKANLTSALGQSYLPASQKELEQTVEAHPDNAQAQVALSKLLMRRGYFEQAYAHLNSAIKIAPTNILYRMDLAVLYDRAGYQQDALLLYRQVLRSAMNEDEPEHLSLPIDSIRQRVAYLENTTAATH